MSRLRVRKPWTEVLEPAPADLDILQAFLNSWDRPIERDELDSPRALSAWLVRWRLSAGEIELTEADLARALRVREALLGLAQCNQGLEVPEWILTRLTEAAAEAPFRIHFGSGGLTSFEPSKDGLAGALARLLRLVARAQQEGRWPRLKACRGKECRRVFYDTSPNHSRIWCSKDLCGARYQMRAFRRRRRHGARR